MRVEKFMRSISGCLSGVLRIVCPCIWKVITSPAEKYTVIKAVLGAPVGAFFGLLLYEVAFYDMKIATIIKLGLGLTFLILIAIGFATTIQVRCMVLLIVPVFLGKEGRSMLSAAAVQYLVKGPVQNLVANAEVFVDSFNCNNNLSYTLMKSKTELMTGPVKELMKDFKKESGRLSRQSRKASRQFSVVENEVDDEDEIADLEEENRRVDKAGGTPNRNEIINKRFKTTKGTSVSKKKEMKYNKKQLLRCEELYSGGVNACKGVFKKSLKNCLKKMPGIVEWLVCSPFKLTFLCKLVKVITKAMGLNCDEKEASSDGFGEAYYTAHLAANAMKKGFGVKMKTAFEAYQQKLDLLTPTEIKEDIMHEFKSRKSWVDYIMELFKTIKAFMFLRVLLASMKYVSNYLTNDEHDNCYMTSYYRKIDARRWMQGKKVLLPLKKNEKKEVIDVYETKLNKAEKKKSISGVAKICSITFVFGMIFFIDQIVVDVLDIIANHSHITYEQQGEHEIQVIVKGDGALAHLLYTMVKNVNHTKAIENAEDNLRCLPVPRRSELEDKMNVFGMLIIILVMTLLDSYTLRLRRVICAFFYPKREKERILFLYNDMTKKRRSHLRYVRRLIRRKAKEQELKLKGSSRIATKLGFGKRKCLICDDTETKHFKPCETQDCRATYCEECWIDIGMKCYACRDEDDWSSHSSDVSID